MGRPVDLVSVIETAYDFETDDQAWLEALTRKVYELIGPGIAMSAFSYELSNPDRVRIDQMSTVVGPRGIDHAIQATAEHATPAILRATVLSGLGCKALSGSSHPGLEVTRRFGGPFGVVDVLGINAPDSDGTGVSLTLALGSVVNVPRDMAWRWERVAIHVAAGRRLRRKFLAEAPLDNPEAVLGPDGKVHHARDRAATPHARQTLQDHARTVDRMRTTRLRQDDDAALDLWQGLVSGRWSLIDHFDSDGRRFVVAHENPPQGADPRALTPQESRIVALASLGYSNKAIGYALGCSKSTASVHLRRAMRKLGCITRGQLVKLVAEIRRPRSVRS